MNIIWCIFAIVLILFVSRKGDIRELGYLGPTKSVYIRGRLTNIRVKIDQRIVVMLTTHNRIGYVKTFSQWIKTDPTFVSGKVDLVIRDDASSSYQEQDLKKWFPSARLFMGKKHIRADQNTRLNFEWFVKSKYDLLVVIDSDSLLDPGWFDFITKHMPKTGFASLYHSNARHHKTHHCNDGVWCHQTSTGALGMSMSKELAKRMLNSNKQQLFDWGIINWLKQNQIPIRVPPKSLVLHYGYYGQNNSPANMQELADGFNLRSVASSIRPCVDFWMSAKNPDNICPNIPTNHSGGETK